MNKFFEAISGFRNNIFPAKMESIQHGLNAMESSLRNALREAGESAYEALAPLVLAAVLPIARLGEAAYEFASSRTAKLTTVFVAAKFALEACSPIPVTSEPPVVEAALPATATESSVSPVVSPEAMPAPTSSVEMQGGGNIFYVNNYEEIVGSEAAANVRAKAQDLMPWLDNDFELNYMGPMGDSVEKARGGFILARDNKDRVYVVGEIIANPNGSGSAIRSVGGPIDVETTENNSIVMNFFDPQSETIRPMMTQDADGVVKFATLDGVETIAQAVHLDVEPNSIKLASTGTDIPIFGFSFDKDIPSPVNVIDGVARYERDGEMWVSSEGKYLRAPMREDGTSYDIWKDDNNVIRVGEKASDWTYLKAVDMTIVSMETGIPVETTYREFETPTIASLIQKGAKFRIDNQGTLVAYDPETEATLAELIDPDNWGWKYASDVENLDLPSVVKSPAELWAEQSGGGFDEINGVAWDNSTGLITWAKDVKGEWINYPDGMVQIPAGPGFENEPPLNVPYYHSFNEAMEAVTGKLGWEELRETFRAEQDAANKQNNNIYWKPLRNSLNYYPAFYEALNVHDSSDPNLEAEVFISEIMTPDGILGLRLGYQSKSTNNFWQYAFVFDEYPQSTFSELKRIDACVVNNAGKQNLKELCASDTVLITAPSK